MNTLDGLAQQFESHRNHLQAVAYRMLGSLSEAEDAIQEVWLRISRVNTEEVANMGGWLTTIVSRICLDMLRSRKARREDSLDTYLPDTFVSQEERCDPEQEAMLADSVGLALLVVLGKLNPAERITFVLHDIFGMPFNEIATVIGKSEAAARQLASRSRRKVQGTGQLHDEDRSGHRQLIDAFIAAARAGDFDTLVAALDPDVLVRDDRHEGTVTFTRGATALAKQISGRAKAAQTALIDGTIGVIAAPRGRLSYVLKFTLKQGKIAEVDLISDPARIRKLDMAVFADQLAPMPSYR